MKYIAWAVVAVLAILLIKKLIEIAKKEKAKADYKKLKEKLMTTKYYKDFVACMDKNKKYLFSISHEDDTFTTDSYCKEIEVTYLSEDEMNNLPLVTQDKVRFSLNFLHMPTGTREKFFVVDEDTRPWTREEKKAINEITGNYFRKLYKDLIQYERPDILARNPDELARTTGKKKDHLKDPY